MKLSALFAFACSLLALASSASGTHPNIVYILADDLGYGDVHCFNPNRGKIATPNIDRLALEGMMFTDAHSGSSVCTPTRYGLLTGRYSWRTRLQKFVLYGYDKPLISAHRLTVPALLRQHGYTTACIGKWHLGMGLPKEQPSPQISDGPTTRGFDSYFGISASLDMPPFAFIDQDRFTQPLTTTKKWQRTGAAAESFEAIDVLPTLTEKAVDFINQQTNTKEPFFLYLPLASPHTPVLPTKNWQGKSGLGKYGDFVMQTDDAVGQVLAAIDKAGVAENTLFIFTSDNGCSKTAQFTRLQAKGHYPSGNLRGLKGDIFEGGHRIPFIVRWPDKIEPNSSSDQTICLNDLIATCADLLDTQLPADAGEDSVSILPTLLGTDHSTLRQAVVHHSINGTFAIRQGDLKLLLCPDSGGLSKPKPGSPEAEGLPSIQLYNLANDLGETNNLQAEHPEEVSRLTNLLKQYIAQGRSTPGPNQSNDAEIVLVKSRKKAGK